jgi:hypothetical protein
MPRQIDYPRGSLKSATLLAKGIDELGGSCKVESAAESLGKKRGGAFQALVGAAVKYGLIENKRGQLSVTPLYREYKLAYNKQEQDAFAQQAFLRVPLFRAIYERFREQRLPVDHFERLLIREFEVPEAVASRVGKYFIEGAKLIGLLNADNSFSRPQSGTTVPSSDAEDTTIDTPEDEPEKVVSDKRLLDSFVSPENFTVRISGPGMDLVLAVNEEEDLAIVATMLKKVEKKLKENRQKEANSEQKAT